MSVPAMSDIANGIAKNLQTITGLTVYSTVPAMISVPCAFVAPPEQINYDEAFGRGLDTYEMRVFVLVSRADDMSGYAALFNYLAPTGATSVKRAVESDRQPGVGALGNLASDIRVSHAHNVGAAYEANGVNYLGAQFTMTVWAQG